MKTLAVCLLVASVVLMVAGETKSRAQMVDDAMKNPRTMEMFTKCMLETGPCSPEMKEIKEKIPTMIENMCAECSKEEIVMYQQAMQNMMDKSPETFAAIKKKLDPKGEKDDDLKKFMSMKQ